MLRDWAIPFILLVSKGGVCTRQHSLWASFEKPESPSFSPNFSKTIIRAVSQGKAKRGVGPFDSKLVERFTQKEKGPISGSRSNGPTQPGGREGALGKKKNDGVAAQQASLGIKQPFFLARASQVETDQKLPWE